MNIRPTTRAIPLTGLFALFTTCVAGALSGQEQPAAQKPPPLHAEGSFTQFGQGNVAGGLETDWEYGGKLELGVTFATEGLGLWKGGSLLAKAATRYGDTANPLTGAGLPVNTALIDPASDGTVTSLVALNYTQLIPLGDPGKMLVVSVGRFDLLDLITEPFVGGNGLTRWMGLPHIAPPHEARNIPLVTQGLTTALVLGGEPVFTFAVFDPEDISTTSGLSDPFGRGVTLYPGAVVPTRFFGKLGHHGIRASWSSQEITPFDQIPQFLLPPSERNITPEEGSWSVTYSANQYLGEWGQPGPEHAGWGLFWQFGLADERTNPIGWFAHVGVGGTPPIHTRQQDYFGLGYAYSALGDDFRELLNPLVDLRDEYNVEAYYRAALTSWALLTADLQVVRPIRPAADVAWVPGVRLQILF